LSEIAPRILFVPVSGAFGTGEYARCSAIARGVADRWPQAALHFVLSRAAPYAAHTPFPATLLAASATFHTAEVAALIHAWRPDVVIFDNAGRTAQLRAARRAGARVVFISSRPRQRARAFRLSWMRLLDEHWIAYPEFIAGAPRWLERRKLAWLGRPTIRFLDVILSRSGAAVHSSMRILAGLEGAAAGYALVVPGGGTGHPGAQDAVSIFMRAAQGLAAAAVPIVFVGRAKYAFEHHAGLRSVGPLPQADLADLMQNASLVVVNGGSTLLQALGMGRACVAAPIAGDQSDRIRRCMQAGIVVAAPLDAEAIRTAAEALWRDSPRRAALAARVCDLRLADGVERAVGALERLLPVG
jgi:hypothetical protein